MAVTRAQLAAASEALALVLDFNRPADAVLHDYFRAHRGLGAGDRAFVAETVYGVLRRKRTVDRLAGTETPRRQALVSLVRHGGLSVRDLAGVLSADERDWLVSIKGAQVDAPSLAEQAELPDWAAERLAAAVGETGFIEAARGLNAPAALDLRVNTLRAARDTVVEDLVASGLHATPTRYSPLGIRVQGRPAINRHPLFLNGTLEVQDEGSQLIGFLVSPRRHDLVIDYCAGAGGKALMLGALMHSCGRVYAFDTSAARLARLKPRLQRSGLSNLHVHPVRAEADARVKRLAGKADRVLVDAPCSGLGTLRRNPDLKWRQSPRSVSELIVKQTAILRAAASLVRPGGRLVYATCSILHEESEDIIGAFVRERPDFETLHCGDLLTRQGIQLDTGRYLRLWPHLHGTDGFFAAALEKSQSAG